MSKIDENWIVWKIEPFDRSKMTQHSPRDRPRSGPKGSSRPKIAGRSAKIGRRQAQDGRKTGQVGGSYGLDVTFAAIAKNVEKHGESGCF